MSVEAGQFTVSLPVSIFLGLGRRRLHDEPWARSSEPHATSDEPKARKYSAGRQSDSSGGGIGYSIVDALDTMLLMGLDTEYTRARTWVQEKLSFDQHGYFSTLEVCCAFDSAVGGGACCGDGIARHILWGSLSRWRRQMNSKIARRGDNVRGRVDADPPRRTANARRQRLTRRSARWGWRALRIVGESVPVPERRAPRSRRDGFPHGRLIFLVRMLMPTLPRRQSATCESSDQLAVAFGTPSSLPGSSVNLGGRTAMNGGAISISEATMLQLEFRYLTEITGRVAFWHKAEKVIKVVDKARLPNGSSWGRGGGPYDADAAKARTNGAKTPREREWVVEYLLKQYIQTNSTEPMYGDAIIMQGVHKHVSKQEHLACFLAGSLMLGATTAHRTKTCLPASA
ncbi:glycoside hydrolase [Mycena olivaceomarginata]|nr:glycoside hydrolase [Mycena olivaceomarginata]